MARGQSTKIISKIKWILTGRLSIKNSPSVHPQAGITKGGLGRRQSHQTSSLQQSEHTCAGNMKVDIRLPGKENSNSHGARPVHQIITMIRWIQTIRLSTKKSLCRQRLTFTDGLTFTEVWSRHLPGWFRGFGGSVRDLL